MRGIPRLAWVGLAILALSAILLSLGKRETEAFPAADSFAPSGSSVLFEILRSRGYKVRIDRSQRPKLANHDLVIAFSVPQEKPFMEEIQQGLSEDLSEELDRPFNYELVEHLRKGGRALLLPMSKDFLTESRTMLNSPAVEVRASGASESLKVTSGSTVPTTPVLSAMDQEFTSIGLWLGLNGEQIIRGIRVGKGTVFVFRDGVVATNRFIDKADNAQLLANAIGVLAPPGTPVVFTEAAFGNVINKGFLEAVGGWLDAAWQQFLLLGLVVIYTLGKRLGLPEEYRRRQRGSRELVDALANTMRRAHGKALAMQAALDSADQELRIALKLPAETERVRRDELLSPELAKALAVLEASILDDETPEWEAARRIKKVDQELTAFLGNRRLLKSQRAKLRI